MKVDFKLIGGIFAASLVLSFAFLAVADILGVQPARPEVMVLGKEKDGTACATIQSNKLLTTDGRVVTPGFDEWGYNYQAHMFNGGYCDAYRDAAWCQEYKDVDLIMKWNDAWLSNQDCDGDTKLDRYHGHDSYIGSGAWLTNHQSGSYIGADGKEHTWTYFVKIIAVPSDAKADGGVWYTADGEEIGPVIWGQFAIVQQVSNDPYAGYSGLDYLSPAGPGFGKWK